MSGANSSADRADGPGHFLVVTTSEPFRRRWERLVEMRGGSVQTRPSLAAAGAGGKSGPLALVVVDAACFPIAGVLADAALPDLRRQARVLLAAADCSVDEELAALAAGIAGCCAHHLGTEELETVIDVVLKGGIWVSRNALPMLLSRLQGASAAGAPKTADGAGKGDAFAKAWSTLTRREKEIALQVAEGVSNKVIAGVFDLSDATIKAHLTSIYQKLGVSSRVQLALLLSAMAGRPAAMAEKV